MVSYLSGPDKGPKSESALSNWNKKLISIATNQMHVEFKSDDFLEDRGFSANIYFTPIPNKECESWLDMTKKIFKSPNYPKTYHKSTKCSWLITVGLENHITLNFIEFYVRLSYNFDFLFLLNFISLTFKFRWELMLIFLQYMMEEVNKLK